MDKCLGTIKFSESLDCAADSLGQTVNVFFAGIGGTLTLPSLPEWGENENDPLHMPLLGPVPVRSWKRGETPIYWGRPVSYPTGTALVDLALLEFNLESENFNANTQNIYNAFGRWLRLFEQYVKLITKQGTRKQIFGGDGPGRLDLLLDNGFKLRHIPWETTTTVSIETYSDESLHKEQFKEASLLASKSLEPRLHYRMLLEAYSARRNEDYRKAIIEAATALEICLEIRILEEFKSLGISFGEKLLQKFRMLGGRFELVRLLDINLPKKNYQELIIDPRNYVIHKASFPDKKLANQVITEVEELLHMFSPQLCENE